MRGFQYIPGSIGLECLLFPTHWFSCAIRSKNIHANAIAQVEIEHLGGRILWAYDLSAPETLVSLDLLDNLAIEAGLRGLHFLSAVVSDDAPVYSVLRKGGYSPYGSLKIWRIKKDLELKNHPGVQWRRSQTSDSLRIDFLRSRIISKRLMSITSPAEKKMPEYVLMLDGEFHGYAHIFSSADKVMITPFIGADAPSAVPALESLIGRYSLQKKDIYIEEYSSQAYIESVLMNCAEVIFPRQEILVKFFAIRSMVKTGNLNHVRANQHTDIITPISESHPFKDNI